MAQNQNSNQSSAAEGIKKSLGLAADVASLRFKLGKAKSRRKAAYTRLGELSYTKYRPRTTDVSEDIENAIAAAVAEITDLTHEITELELRIKLLKAGA
ncbi:MAG: hypothetical protein J6K29_11720 [Clostridia bacterium]|nr:hypothetical protein [Clostridia bacterium]